MAASLTSEEREYARWLGRVEVHAILPIKVAILLVCAVFWIWVRHWEPPSVPAFGLFFLYGSFTLAEFYFFWRDRVTPGQVRPFVTLSYLVDMAFITALIWLDAQDTPAQLKSMPPGGDFYILYFLLVMRGFALFRTVVENLIMAVLISILFLVSLWWQGAAADVLSKETVVLRLALIWAVMLMASYIVEIVNQQKEEVLRTRERLVRSEGLAALGELAAGVAHEINNPIGIITAYTDYLKKTTAADDPHLEDYETIGKEARRCEAIVRQMLDYANPKVRSFVPFSLGPVVAETLGFVFHEKLGGSIEATMEALGDLPDVMGDAGQVRQALLNVLINARHAVQAKGGPGKVKVRLGRATGPRAPVEIVVHDSGVGIAAEDAARAFEPFFTRRAEGTGLGLAITRQIIAAHEGTIEIRPAAEGGTDVVIRLPIAGEDRG